MAEINVVQRVNAIIAVVIACMIAFVIPATKILFHEDGTTTGTSSRYYAQPPPWTGTWNHLTQVQRDEIRSHSNSTARNIAMSELLREEYVVQLGITEKLLVSFHPVVIFPRVVVKKSPHEYYEYYKVLNLTVLSSKDMMTLATTDDDNPLHAYGVGIYDEIRTNLYDTDLFQENSGDDDDNSPRRRIVHMGIDLGAPVKTPVFAFSDGFVYHSGYNSAKGDYGNVIVVEHHFIKEATTATMTTKVKNTSSTTNNRTTTTRIWALYGHLSNSSLIQCKVGDKIRRGQIVGWIGNVYENGGWFQPHVHFQLSLTPPKTHDMPGVVTLLDRDTCKKQYPDPRVVLGMLYY